LAAACLCLGAEIHAWWATCRSRCACSRVMGGGRTGSGVTLGVSCNIRHQHLLNWMFEATRKMGGCQYMALPCKAAVFCACMLVPQASMSSRLLAYPAHICATGVLPKARRSCFARPLGNTAMGRTGSTDSKGVRSTSDGDPYHNASRLSFAKISHGR
jgi:hypothetical protein